MELVAIKATHLFSLNEGGLTGALYLGDGGGHPMVKGG